MTRPTLCFVLGALAAALTTAVGAQQAQQEERLVLRTYPVGDIVLRVSDYPYGESESSLTRRSGRSMGGGGLGGGGLGGGGGGAFAVPDNIDSTGYRFRQTQFGGRGGEFAPGSVAGDGGVSITMEDLIDTMYQVVAPDSWAERGGGEAAVRPLGDLLIVLQTPEAHQQIEQMLAMIRENVGGRQAITVDARWVMLDSDGLDELLADEQDVEGPPLVDPAALAKATRQSDTLRCVTNCFSGQLVYVVGGTQRNVVTSYIPVVGGVFDPEGAGRLVSAQAPGGSLPVTTTQLVAKATPVQSSKAVGYQPVITSYNLGVLLEIRPTLVSGTDWAMVDLKYSLTGGDAEPTVGQQANVSAAPTPAVDRLAVERQELATTLRMPRGRPVLIGGMSRIDGGGSRPQNSEATDPPPQEAKSETKQVYLVLELQ